MTLNLLPCSISLGKYKHQRLCLCRCPLSLQSELPSKQPHTAGCFKNARWGIQHSTSECAADRRLIALYFSKFMFPLPVLQLLLRGRFSAEARRNHAKKQPRKEATTQRSNHAKKQPRKETTTQRSNQRGGDRSGSEPLKLRGTSIKQRPRWNQCRVVSNARERARFCFFCFSWMFLSC